MVFHTAEKRDEVFKKKAKLKSKKSWLREDFTPAKSRLAYLARLWAKKDDDASTWTADGRVFIKPKDQKPFRIDTDGDIPRE